MKRIFILLLIFTLFITGCEEKNGNQASALENTEVVSDGVEMFDLYQDLAKRLDLVESENESLKEKLNNLENENKSLKDKVSSLDSNYKNINNNGSKNTITKKELIGTWRFEDHDVTFTNDNVEIDGNWIIYNGKSSIYYMYKNGKLYIADDGVIYTKD